MYYCWYLVHTPDHSRYIEELRAFKTREDLYLFMDTVNGDPHTQARETFADYVSQSDLVKSHETPGNFTRITQEHLNENGKD